MITSLPRKFSSMALGSLLAIAIVPNLSPAANISLNANDSLGQSSFNSGAHWVGGAAPVAGNNYFTAGWQMRTPGDTANWTFAGDSLTLDNPTTAGAGNLSMMDKTSAAAGAGRTLTINNLTNAAGGGIRTGNANGTILHLAGNHYTIAGNSSIWADQSVWIIDSPLIGGDSVVLTNYAVANTGAGVWNHITHTANNSAFTGSWLIRANTYNINACVEVQSASSLPANPSIANPRQITFGANGVLLDSVGCTLNNSRGGITLEANGTISAAATTTVAVQILDLTNGVSSVSALTKDGAGTMVLSSSNNYSGGTVVTAGTLQAAAAGAIPPGNLTVNGILDLNGYSVTANNLSGSGTVDTTTGGTPTLTVGVNNGGGTFSGMMQNSSGTLSLTKVGTGTLTLSSGYSHAGATVVAGGTLNVSTIGSLPGSPGALVVSNGAVLNIDASIGTALPAQDVDVGADGTLRLTLTPTATGLNANGNLSFASNATNTFSYGTLAANPSAAAINVTGNLSAPGATIYIVINAVGLKNGTFTLIDYAGTGPADLVNFVLVTPPGVLATLENNTGNTSIDVNIGSAPLNLSWYGSLGAAWDTSSGNWSDGVTFGMLYQQYTNGSVIAGDGVRFDDTLYNDFINPQMTNINLSITAYPFPLIVDSTFPYSFSGAGGIAGPTSLVKSNTGSLALLTANSYAGGTHIYGGSVIISSDSALGLAATPVTLSGSTLQMNGNVTNSRAISMPASSLVGVAAGATARLNSGISGAGGLTKIDNGTLILAASNTFAGSLFVKAGTVVLESGAISSPGGVWDSIGQDTTDNGTLTLKGTAAFRAAFDFNIGDIDASIGTLNIQDSAFLGVNNFFVASANNAGSTAVGTVNQSGGSLVQSNGAVGMFSLGGRNAATAGGVGTYNLTAGNLTATAGIRVGGYGVGTFNQSGGTLLAVGGINIARLAGSSGTFNLNGGVFRTFNVASSTGSNAVFNFNGGTMLPTTNAAATTWMQGLSAAFIRNGAAIIDVTNMDLTIAQPLLHSTNAGDAAIDGGLTKRGSATLTLSGVNTFTGPITNAAGTLLLNSASTNSGAVYINAGTVSLTTATRLAGNTAVANGATLSIYQSGSATATLSNLTLSGTVSPGARLGLGITAANNSAVPMVNCGTLTLNGTNSINLAGAVKVGSIALVKYTGTAGTGNCTNLVLPQGAIGSVSNDTVNSVLYAVITSTGPGIVWTGTNVNVSLTNLWDVNATTNWLIGSAATSYRQSIIPGDAVTFNDVGSGVAILNTIAGPAGVTFSNTAKSYTLRGNGSLTGPAGLQKLGAGTVVLNLTNNSYLGDTIVSNGTVQLGTSNALSTTANLVVGPAATLQMAGFSATVAELTGSGVVDNNSGSTVVLTVGGSAGGTWNGTIQDHGAGGAALIKNGSGTWRIGGNNYLNNGDGFYTRAQFNGGTTIITNGGLVSVPWMETWIAQGAVSSTVIIDGGTLAVSNNWLCIGRGDAAANGTLIVNSGTVVKAGNNNIAVGSTGGTGTLTVNGGQVLNNGMLWLGENATGNGTLYLNGGLVQATQVRPNNAPLTSSAYFNGGTLQASAASADFIQSSAYVQNGGLVLDDGGYVISLASMPLVEDSASPGGGLIKQGAGAVYLEAANGYTGTTVVSNGLLAGVGSINGPVLVAPAGSIGGGNVNLGALTINGMPLTIQGAAVMRINKNGGSISHDQIIGISAVNFGGTLVITNTTSDATLLAVGDTFPLFTFGSRTGNFTSIVGSPGTGLAYSFDPASGVLSVITAPVIPTTPIPITAVLSGGNLVISWPASYVGWDLQSNSVAVDNASMWFTIPGSTAVDQMALPINPNQSQVFYRLHYLAP